MPEHQFEMASLVKFLVNLLGNSIIERVQISCIQTIEVGFFVEILVKHVFPDVISIEDDPLFVRRTLSNLEKHTIFVHFT